MHKSSSANIRATIVEIRAALARVSGGEHALAKQKKGEDGPEIWETRGSARTCCRGAHTIMELVLAALPVETAGALLRTGATAERAAI